MLTFFAIAGGFIGVLLVDFLFSLKGYIKLAKQQQADFDKWLEEN